MNFFTHPLLAETADAPLTWRVRWDWNWPLWLTALLLVAATAWVMAIYFRESTTAGSRMRIFLGLLRLVALALVLLMFAQPAVEWYRVGRPRLVVLGDRSGSMNTLDRHGDETNEVTRIAAWKDFLTQGDSPLLDRWQRDYALEVLAFDEQLDLLTTSGGTLDEQVQSLPAARESNDGTRLGDAIDYALRELPGPSPVAIVALTDGITTRGQTLQQAAQRARRMRVPLYTVAVGSERPRADIAVENLLVEEIVFPGDRLQVEATVRSTGYEGKSVEAVLSDGADRVLASTPVTLSQDNQSQAVRLTIRPEQPGPLNLELAIAPLDDEANIENNTARQIVEVRDEKIRVLLLQSQPSYEYRALKSLLQRDPAVDLHVLLQEADADYPAVDDTALSAFPSSERELFAYDVLILGDADVNLLPRSTWPLVERFVTEHGGGLVAISGPRFMPLAYRGIRALEILLPMPLESLNPLRSQLSGTETFAIYPTALGWRAPSLQLGETRTESERIWRALPPVTWLLRLDEIKPGAQVLAENPAQTNRQGRPLPVILRQYVGAGEVLFHATDETWRWRWRTDDRYFARYWGQVMRRLGRGRLAAGKSGVQLTTDRSLYEPGEPVQLHARFRNPSQAPAEADQVIVQLQGATGPTRQIALRRRMGRRGLFTATVEELPPGEYESLLVRPALDKPTEKARFEIRRPPRELAEVVVNREGLRLAAETSGGKSYTLATAARLPQELPPPSQQTRSEMPPRQLWNSHAILALLVIVLTGEWLLRRRYGML